MVMTLGATGPLALEDRVRHIVAEGEEQPVGP